MSKKQITTLVLLLIVLIVSLYIIFKEQIDRMIKKNLLNNNTDFDDSQPLLFSEKVKVNKDQFIKRLKEISIDEDINPNALMFWINFESAGTFSPSIQNSIKATGLIQFLPSTAITLGTTVDQLKLMSNVEQLEYVKKYFEVWKSRMKDWLDVYLAIFYPAAIGKPDSYALPKGVTPQNPQFDYVIKDGIITVGEIRKYFQNRVKTTTPKSYWKYFGL